MYSSRGMGQTPADLSMSLNPNTTGPTDCASCHASGLTALFTPLCWQYTGSPCATITAGATPAFIPPAPTQAQINAMTPDQLATWQTQQMIANEQAAALAAAQTDPNANENILDWLSNSANYPSLPGLPNACSDPTSLLCWASQNMNTIIIGGLVIAGFVAFQLVRR